jgi:DNA replicative helicase MCM subunit Mcm2 (Cdc46/Mcm family)
MCGAVENEEDPTKRKSLLQRLDPSPIPADTLIPPLLVRKYIAYAKKYVSPKCVAHLRPLATCPEAPGLFG